MSSRDDFDRFFISLSVPDQKWESRNLMKLIRESCLEINFQLVALLADGFLPIESESQKVYGADQTIRIVLLKEISRRYPDVVARGVTLESAGILFRYYCFCKTWRKAKILTPESISILSNFATERLTGMAEGRVVPTNWAGEHFTEYYSSLLVLHKGTPRLVEDVKLIERALAVWEVADPRPKDAWPRYCGKVRSSLAGCT